MSLSMLGSFISLYCYDVTRLQMMGHCCFMFVERVEG